MQLRSHDLAEIKVIADLPLSGKGIAMKYKRALSIPMKSCYIKKHTTNRI